MESRAYQSLNVTQEAGVATLTLAAPARKNALSPEMVNELLWALDDAAASNAVRVVVLTGAGDNFCAGADLARMGGANGPGGGEAAALAHRGDFADLLLRLDGFEKPTVAVVRGAALGGGLGLVASCHFALAAASAVLGTPEIKRGVFPMMIMAVLARVVPPRKLMELMLLGDKWPAPDAASAGLLTRVVPDAALAAAAAELTGKLAALSPTALAHGLRAHHRHVRGDLSHALPALREALFLLLGTEDAQEGIRAFLEKRPPVWTGR